MENGGEKIIKINIEEEMKSSYIDYSMSVIVSRALPDVRDGLKPVHRRVLFGMDELGLTSGKPYKKSARIVGEVLGKYHPHGDSSVYMAMVRMAQEWSLRYPLVDGQGNFGSVDGDSPAAMRYTEARMAKITEDMLIDIDKDTVDFLFVDQVGNPGNQLCFVDHIGDFVNDQLFPTVRHHLYRSFRTNDDTSPPGQIGFTYSTVSVDRSTGRKIRSFNNFDQLFDVDIVIIDISTNSIYSVFDVVRRHIGSHTDGNPRGSVH